MTRPKKITKETVLFTCECGKSRLLWKSDIFPKKCVKCTSKERCVKHFAIHNQSRTSEHNTWMQIIQRCYNENNQNYEIHGAVNIIVCDEWLGKNGFINFYKDVGAKPLSRHRIILGRFDYSEDFTPENCKWMTVKEANAYGRLNR